MKITVILEDELGRQFNVDVEENIIREEGLVVYKKEFYQYTDYKGVHRYIKLKQPAFIG